MKENKKRNSIIGITLVIFAIVLGVIGTKTFYPEMFKKTPTEIVLNQVDSIQLDQNAMTFTYAIDPVKTEPVYIGNSLGYPTDPKGNISKGIIVNILDSNGKSGPVWISENGKFIVSSFKLGTASWANSGIIPIATNPVDSTSKTQNTTSGQ